jgi:hypothetical protein
MKKSVLISLVLIVLGAGMVAYAKCAASSSDSVPVKVEQRLREKAQAGKAYCDKNGYNTNYCFLVDFSIHSGKRRFFVWDFKGDSVKYASLCAHGYGKNSTVSKPVFSNVEGSVLFRDLTIPAYPQILGCSHRKSCAGTSAFELDQWDE